MLSILDPATSNNDIQYNKYVKDLDKNPCYIPVIGTYRSVQWVIRRTKSTYLRGRILMSKMPKHRDPKIVCHVENASHWSDGPGNRYSFDCCHLGDWWYCSYSEKITYGEYRDFEYVMARLFSMIDNYWELMTVRPRSNILPKIDTWSWIH